MRQPNRHSTRLQRTLSFRALCHGVFLTLFCLLFVLDQSYIREDSQLTSVEDEPRYGIITNQDDEGDEAGHKRSHPPVSAETAFEGSEAPDEGESTGSGDDLASGPDSAHSKGMIVHFGKVQLAKLVHSCGSVCKVSLVILYHSWRVFLI